MQMHSFSNIFDTRLVESANVNPLDTKGMVNDVKYCVGC